MRTFEFGDAKSHKFWSIAVNGRTFTVTFGKVGTDGQSQTKTFATPEKAQAEADKLVREKTKKGYGETTPKAAASDAERFEAALRANPDDLAGHCAFADFLAEKGDPRGEFMQVQIALEDENLPAAERKKLAAREAALLKKHKAAWVGAWADHPNLHDPAEDWTAPKGWVPYGFTRGLLTKLELGDVNVSLAREVVKAPQLAFVRDFTVRGIAFEEEGDFEAGPDTRDSDREEPAQHVLVRWRQLRYVRRFVFGGCEPHEYGYDYNPYRCHMPGDLVPDFVKQMPDVEELVILAHTDNEDQQRLAKLPMPRLHTLYLYHGWAFPGSLLAANKTLGNLRTLCVHPHAQEYGSEAYIGLEDIQAIARSKHLTNLKHLQLRMADFGDAGITEIVTSGLIKRLEVLDLRHGLVTDVGATVLAKCPDAAKLRHIDLRQNRIGKDGVKALKAAKLNVLADHQQDPAADPWNTFGQGDIE